MAMSTLLMGFMAIVLATGACGTDVGTDGPAADGSGIRGIVLTGPLCPVVVEGSPCPDQPWEGIVRVSGTDGQVAEVATDAKGRFAVTVRPGTYDVGPVMEGAVPGFSRSERVTVTDGDVIVITLTVDTGIR
jgi:hypothetical protein